MTWLDSILALLKGKGAQAVPPDPPITTPDPPTPLPPPAPKPKPAPPAVPATPAAPATPSPSSRSPLVPPVMPTRPTIPPPPGAAPTPAQTRPVIPDVMPPARLTGSLLALALGITPTRATLWAYPLEDAMTQYGIATPTQRAAFLSQIGHESGRLQYVRELWGPTAEQALYEPSTPKSRALGNTSKGDGYRFRGGGLLQITGRYNFRLMGQRLGIDLENNPDLIERPQYAALVSAAYWSDRNLNKYCDAGDFVALSKAINLGNPNSVHTPNGMSDRLLLWTLCKNAYGIA